MRRRPSPVPPSWWIPLALLAVLVVWATVGVRRGPAGAGGPGPGDQVGGGGRGAVPTVVATMPASPIDPCAPVLDAWVGLAGASPVGEGAAERAAAVRALLPDPLGAAFDRWWTELRGSRPAPPGAVVAPAPEIDEWFARGCP